MAINKNIFQGSLAKEHYFEGWYYKQVSADAKTAISFIPGLSLLDDDKHSFIQYILVDERLEKGISTGYLRFPVSAFRWEDNPFKIEIGANTFTNDAVTVALQTDTDTISGTLQLGPLTPIKTSVYAPTIMGPFTYIPKMECYHGIVSMNHQLSGSLEINEHTVDFTNGKGYIEKDWGSKFPQNYIWLQCNHFPEEDTSLFFSMAYIPFYVRDFLGFICNIQVQGKEYRFATYNNSLVNLASLTDKRVSIALENAAASVSIHAEIHHQGHLLAPVASGMDKIIKEGVSGMIHLNLWDKQKDFHYQGTGYMAGIEIVDAQPLKVEG